MNFSHLGASIDDNIMEHNFMQDKGMICGFFFMYLAFLFGSIL